MTRRFSRITGTGSHLPARRVTNDDLVAQLAGQGIETSDEWIVERTGIRARHFAERGQDGRDEASRLDVAARLEQTCAAADVGEEDGQLLAHRRAV